METIEKPKISVIVPVYNVEKYLAECLDSILRQTFTDFELLLINDASTDRSWEISLSYAQKDQRIRLLENEENLGLSLTRNHGLREAKGDYIAFIDSDDIVADNYLMTLWSGAEKTKADVVSMGYIEYAEKQGGGAYYDRRHINIVKEAGLFTDDIKKRIELMCKWSLILVAWGKLYKKELLIRHRIKFEKIVSEDILFGFAVLYAADKYMLIPDNLYYYRQNPDSITRGGNIDKLKRSLQASIMVHRFINKYLKSMPDIYTDKKLVKDIHEFFTETLWRYLFFGVSQGLLEKDILNMSDDVFSEYMPEDSEFIGYLFKHFLETKKYI